MSDKIGRNDPCYCGSGKKYKQCHMKEDKEKERGRLATAMAARFVRGDLLKFARGESYAAAFAAGLTHYWNGLYTIENAEEMEESEALRFFDWFIYDYAHEGAPRLIETYKEERAAELSTAQQEILEDWLAAGAAGAYELISYEGQTLQLRDHLTGAEWELFTSGGRGNVEIGEVILARIIKLEGRNQFSTTAADLPAAEIGDIKAQMAAAEETFLAEQPEADHITFMRANNYRLIHHALAEAERIGRPPVARLDPDRDDGAMRNTARLLARQMGRRRRR